MLELPAIVERFATDFDGLPEIVDGVQPVAWSSRRECSYERSQCSAWPTFDITVDLIGLRVGP